ncbi:MAG TPA: AraC family transcriptional regulator [Polyangiales bacterium]|nr:AraC family transcriptional regulator [Polyangiales bacterium]
MSRPEIERALRFIAAHLDRPLRAAEVARAAHLSEFHLHRVFHAEVGESLGRFITRRRLEQAALRLAYEPDVPITEIALGSGYSSSSNFSKAFSAFFGVSPSRVREPADLPVSVSKLATEYAKKFVPESLFALPATRDSQERARVAAEWDRRVRFEDTAVRSFACLASPAGYDLEAIEQTWHALIRRARQLGLADDAVDAWAVAHDSPELTAPELCRYHACVPCAPDVALPAPLFRGAMAAGRYAVFYYQGLAAELGPAYRSIYSCWFPEISTTR